jgi:ABC-type sugar transport system ATPase subunit
MESLRTEGLTKQFPGVLALHNVDFTLEKGEVHAIVGENGAGKSTFVKILAGVYPATSGRIYLDNNEIKFSSPREASAFIGVVHQERELIPFYSGIENLFLGQEMKLLGFLKKKAMKEKAIDFMNKYGLQLDMERPVSSLSSGMQEMLSILKILFRSPHIIIFDEPTAPLSIKEAEILFELIGDLKKAGTSIIYITHHLMEVIQLADRVSVLRNGEKVTTMKVSDTNEQEIIKLMIAKDMGQQYPKTFFAPAQEMLHIEFYDSEKRSKAANQNQSVPNICIHSKEIVGFAGLVGSGRSELAKAIITGPCEDTLSVMLDGKAFIPRNPKFAIKNGIVMIPEDRRGEGLITSFDVKENLSFSRLSYLSRIGFRSEKKINSRCAEIIKDLSIKVFSPAQSVATLSGGNQQKVSLGKWFDANAKLWIFDEPTQGIDVETKSEIYRIMERLASQGAGIWFISSDLRELLAISDKIYVMYQSRVVGEFIRPFDSEKILQAMLGRNADKSAEVLS